MKKVSVASIATYLTLGIVACNFMINTFTAQKIDVIETRVDKIDAEILRLEGRISNLENK